MPANVQADFKGYPRPPTCGMADSAYSAFGTAGSSCVPSPAARVRFHHGTIAARERVALSAHRLVSSDDDARALDESGITPLDHTPR